LAIAFPAAILAPSESAARYNPVWPHRRRCRKRTQLSSGRN